MYIQKGKEISMKRIWKKLHQKTAVMLVASMLFTSVVPMTGLAAVYDTNMILSDDQFDSSDYLATASVAAVAYPEEDQIKLAEDADGAYWFGEVAVQTKYNVTVATVSNATESDALASDSNWERVKAQIEEEIISKLSMTATVSNVDPAIESYVYLNNEIQEGRVTVSVEIPSEDMLSLTEESYGITLQFIPELNEGELGDNIVITGYTSCSVELAVNAGNGEDPNPDGPKESSVELRYFHDDDKDGKTWIYVGDDPVDLNDYCETNPGGLNVVFTSSNPEVATVSDADELIPLAMGRTTITAKVAEAGYAESTDTMEVDIWVGEQMEVMPDAFELYEGGTWSYTFPQALSGKSSTCILDMEGNMVDKSVADVSFSDGRKTVTVHAKKAGEYQLRCISHDADQPITYYGYVDFIVRPLENTIFSMNGFNGELADATGKTTTWTYVEYGWRDLLSYCNIAADDATVTFTSSDEAVATIEGSYFVPVGTGRTTITATMKAPKYPTVTHTFVVDVWKFKTQNSLPEMITMHEGETWTHTFAEPLRNNTKVFVSYWYTDREESVGNDIVKASLSEDRKTLTVEAKKAGDYRLYYRSHNEAEYTTYYDETMSLTVLEKGVNLSVSLNQIVVEPGKSVTFEVEYSPENAKLEFDYDPEVIKVTNENGKVTVTGLSAPDYGYAELGVILFDGEKILAEKWLRVIVAEKQLEATTVEEALTEASAKITEALINGDEGALYKIVNEVVEILAEAPQGELSANLAAIDELEELLSNVAVVEDEVYGDDVEIGVSGALLNLLSMGENNGKLVVKPVEDPANTAGVTLDIKLQKGSTGENITELAVPMQIRVKVSGIDLTKNIRIKHTKENGTVKWIYPTVDGEYIVFWVDSYSTFAISNYSSGSGGSGGGGGGSSSSKTTSGTVSSDAKKGYVNSITGIITGSGVGYSRWSQDEAGWKLQYADGTFAAGVMLTDQNGNPYEQVAWELINGAWYPFGADGYVRSGMVYDVALGGTFYVDINSGMKTGWQQVDGVWRYFNTESNGKRGIMLTDTTIDGYYIDAEGIWKA